MSTDNPQPQDQTKDTPNSDAAVAVPDSENVASPAETAASGEGSPVEDAPAVDAANVATPVPDVSTEKPEETAAPATEESAAPVEGTTSADSTIPAESTPPTGPTVAEDTASTATPEASDQPPTGETAEPTEKPKRKIQLNPTPLAGDAGAIPTMPNSAPAPSGPVEVPSATDDDVEAEISKAITGITEPSASVSDESGAPAAPTRIPPQEDIDASIEAAIEAAMSGSEGDAGGPSGMTDPDEIQPGTKFTGVVQSIHGDNVFLDLGLRLTGVVPFRQFEKNPPKEGDSVEVAFAGVNEEEGLIQTNLPRAAATISGGDWSSVTVGQVVECMVTKTNKGGLEVKVGGLRGFMPASQVDSAFVEDLSVFVGQKIKAKITEVKPNKKRLIVSRRKILAEERESLKQELLEELKPDQVRTGVVKTIKDFGAFVDLGGMDGFLPISQMSWVRIEHPSELLTKGQEIEVKVLSIDRDKNKVSLGTRQLSPNPWRVAEDRYPKGSTVSGRVTRIESFGAFVELEPGIEGLVHISELDHRRVKSVSEVMKQDDLVDVQVIEVDPGKKRISLSVKALKAKPEPKEQPEEPEVPAYERKRKGPLKGGTGRTGGGGLFGNPDDFKTK